MISNSREHETAEEISCEAVMQRERNILLIRTQQSRCGLPWRRGGHISTEETDHVMHLNTLVSTFGRDFPYKSETKFAAATCSFQVSFWNF